MAAYPSHSVALASQPTLESMEQRDVSANGTMHYRQFHSKQYYGFDVVHPGLTGQQFADLLATYHAGPGDEYTGFTWFSSSPSVTYTVKFTGPPQIVESHGNNLFDVRVPLRGWVT